MAKTMSLTLLIQKKRLTIISTLYFPVHVNKGSGPDDIPLLMLRECADEIDPSLTTLVNLSMSTCTLPEQ